MGRFPCSKWGLLGIIAFVVILMACTGAEEVAGPMGPRGEPGPQGPPGVTAPTQPPSEMFHATASNVWIVGGYGDNFVYTGENYTPTDGFLTIDVIDETNEGMLVAQWDVRDWKYDDSKPRASGTMKVIWTDFFGQTDLTDFMDGGISNDLHLHGDSGQESPLLPTLYTYSAGWGSADVYLNDEMLYDHVVAHYMVTDGTRDPRTHAVHTRDGVGIFKPAPKGGDPGDGFTYPERILTHLVVHTDVLDRNNFPPFTMFMHINFENTSISTASQP